jgi:hypothetical protein
MSDEMKIDREVGCQRDRVLENQAIGPFGSAKSAELAAHRTP